MLKRILFPVPLLMLLAVPLAFGEKLLDHAFNVDQLVPIDPTAIACNLPAGIIACNIPNNPSGKCYNLRLFGDVHVVIEKTTNSEDGTCNGTCNFSFRVNYENMRGFNPVTGTSYRLLGDYFLWVLDSKDCSLAALFSPATGSLFNVRLIGAEGDLLVKGNFFLSQSSVPGQGGIKFDNWVNLSSVCKVPGTPVAAAASRCEHELNDITIFK